MSADRKWRPEHDEVILAGRAAGHTGQMMADELWKRFNFDVRQQQVSMRLRTLRDRGVPMAKARIGAPQTRPTVRLGAGAEAKEHIEPSAVLPPEITGVAYPPRSCCHWPTWPTDGERPRVLTFCGAHVKRIGAVYCDRHAAKAYRHPSDAAEAGVAA